MIYDELTHWKQYFKGPIFDDIYQKLGMISTDTPNGEHFRTDSYYFKVMSYSTMDNPTIVETHRKEVDVQIVLNGGEKIKIYDPRNLEVKTPYDEALDCQFYKVANKAAMEFDLVPNKMAVFFPQDAHGCQHIRANESETIKKIVIKIDEKLFTHQE